MEWCIKISPHLTIFAPSLSFVSVLVSLLTTNLLPLFNPGLIILDGTLFNINLLQVAIFYNSTTNVIRGIRFSFTNDSAVGIGEHEDTFNHSTHSFNYTGYGVLSYFKVYMRGPEMVKLEAFWMRWCQCLCLSYYPPFFFFKRNVLKMSIKLVLISNPWIVWYFNGVMCFQAQQHPGTSGHRMWRTIPMDSTKDISMVKMLTDLFRLMRTFIFIIHTSCAKKASIRPDHTEQSKIRA